MRVESIAPKIGRIRQEQAARGAFAASLIAAALSVAAAVVGLTAGARVYGQIGADAALVHNDLVTLVFAIPLLLISAVLARRHRPLGTYTWLAVLLYLAYIYVPYGIDVPSRAMLGIYAPLLAIIVLAGALLIISIRKSRQGSVTVRKPGLGIFLLALAAFLLIYQGINVVGVLFGLQAEIRGTVGVVVADLVVGIPLLIITGIQSVRGKGLGSAGGATMLLAFAVLSIGLLVVFIIQAVEGQSEFSLVDFIVVLLMAAACLVVFTLVVRRGGSDGTGVSENG
jgi:hypothetical protein